MNPYTLLIAGAALVAALGGSFLYGRSVGADSVIAEQERTRKAVQETRDLAQQGAAAAIADMEIKNVTITQPIRTEVRTRTVYAECKHTDAGLRSLNTAIVGRPDATSESKLPGTDAAPAGR